MQPAVSPELVAKINDVTKQYPYCTIELRVQDGKVTHWRAIPSFVEAKTE